MEHFLPAAFACVDQGFEAVGQICRFSNLRDFQHHFAQEGLMFGRGVCQRVEMDFRNQQQMNRRGGADVFEAQHLVVFVHGLRAEDVVNELARRQGLSGLAEKASRKEP